MKHRLSITRTFAVLFCLPSLLLVACGGPAPSSETISGAPPAKEITQNNTYDDGTYIIYFNVINSDTLDPDIARENNLTRSKNRALINISVKKREPDNSTVAIQAELNAKVSNLTGQLKNVDWRVRNEQGEAIYHLGLVGIANGETLIVELNVQPDGAADPIPVRFQQRMFTQ